MKKIFGIGAAVAAALVYATVCFIENDIVAPLHGTLIGMLSIILSGICASLAGWMCHE